MKALIVLTIALLTVSTASATGPRFRRGFNAGVRAATPPCQRGFHGQRDFRDGTPRVNVIVR